MPTLLVLSTAHPIVQQDKWYGRPVYLFSTADATTRRGFTIGPAIGRRPLP
jgi:hypothetical protein